MIVYMVIVPSFIQKTVKATLSNYEFSMKRKNHDGTCLVNRSVFFSRIADEICQVFIGDQFQEHVISSIARNTSDVHIAHKSQYE